MSLKDITVPDLEKTASAQKSIYLIKFVYL